MNRAATYNSVHSSHAAIFRNFIMQLSASIFKAYDIRGIVPSTINEAVAEALAPRPPLR